MNEINKALEVLKDDSKPRNRADLLRVLTEWNRATGVFVVSGSWFYEVQGMLEDAFDCGAALAASQFTPLAWVHEDELPEGFPYEQLFPYSKVDIVRMFPIFGPSAGQCGESCERAKLCGACARGLEEVPEPAASEREAFEAWARDQWGDRPVPNNAWLGWQGRAALAASQPAPVGSGALLKGLADAVQELKEDGFWRSCSGCHELNEGHDTGPRSAALGCALGSGCGECGGLGAVWDTTDYASMAAPVEAQADLLAKRADEEMARAEHYKERALRAEAQAVPAGWSIRRTPGKAEIGITTPEDGPGGMFVSPSDRDLARRVLYALCESLSASNQNGGE